LTLLKRHIVGIASATVFTFAAGWLFGLISGSSVAMYGANVKEATVIITTALFRIYTPILLASAVVFSLLSLSKQKYVHFLYLLCGILSCVVTLVVCTSSLSFYGVTPELRVLCEEGAKSILLAYGIAFPILHTLLCILSYGERMEDVLINQALSTGIFLMLFVLFANVVMKPLPLSFMKITIEACLAAVITIAPTLNLNMIRQQIKKKV